MDYLLKNNKIKLRFKPAFKECIYSESSEEYDYIDEEESEEESLFERIELPLIQLT